MNSLAVGVMVSIVAASSPAWADDALAVRRGPSLEVNVLWPFFPGGISEFRVLVPAVRRAAPTWYGDVVVGLYSDFASRVVRDDSHGKVANLSGKLGWRQTLVHGLHAEVTANLGWRHEEHRPPDDATVDGFQIRLWTLAGYQRELSDTIYLNARGGVGVHVYRSDRLAGLERIWAPGGDVNLGVRF